MTSIVKNAIAKKITAVFYMTIAMALVWIFVPGMFRFKNTIGEAVLVAALVPLTYLVRTGSYKAYRATRMILWCIWIYTGCWVIYIVILSGGDSSAFSFGNDSHVPVQFKRIGTAIQRMSLTYALALTYFKTRKEIAAEQVPLSSIGHND